jgi:hypothetical protein
MRGAIGLIVAADDAAQDRETTPPLPERLVLTPLERREYDFSHLNRWMREADQAIRRTKAVLDRLAAQPSPPASDGGWRPAARGPAPSENGRRTVRRVGRVLVVDPCSVGERATAARAGN